MSRSEHATRRDPRDPGDRERKRRIKHLVAEERARPRVPTPAASADGVPITVRDRGRFVHYPASASDVRAVLARVPIHTADGLGHIELCLDERRDPEVETVDPYLGLLGNEIFPGVYSGEWLGVYRSGDTSDIRLFGYIFDPALPDRPVLELFLRLQMLSTLVHELGHHRDHRERVARGRWRADDGDEAEIFAEAIEHAWTRAHVIPYLEEAYPAEVTALAQWLVHHGGVALPLETLIGDPRTTAGLTGERLFFSARSAFAQLVRDVAAGEQPPARQIGFARDLHYGGYYDEALAILDHVERAYPDAQAGRVLRADIYVHQDRHDDAAAIAGDVLARDPDDPDALEVLCDVALARGDWARVLELAARRTALLDEGGWTWNSSVHLELQAAIELGAWEAVDARLGDARAAATSSIAQQRICHLEALLALRRGRYADALALVADLPRKSRYPEIVALEFDASHRLDLPCDPDAMQAILEPLRRRGYHTWAARLEAVALAVRPP